MCLRSEKSHAPIVDMFAETLGVGDFVNLDGEAPARATDPSITQSGGERGSDEFFY